MKGYRWATLALVIASIGDYVTTVVGITSGGMAEANPTAVQFMDAFGVFVGFALLSIIGLVMIMGLSLVLQKMDWRGSTAACYTGLAVFTGGKLFATVWNTLLIF